MKTVLILFSCFFLLSCTTRTRKAEAVHSPYDTVSVYVKDEEGQKIYNVVSEKAVTANGDSLFDKRRTEVPKQLSDKEFELAKAVVRKYIHGHQDEFLPFDSYFQQYLGYKKEGVFMRRFAIFVQPRTSVSTVQRRTRYYTTYRPRPSRKSLSAN